MNLTQNFVVAGPSGGGNKSGTRGMGASSSRFGGTSQPEQKKKMEALKELLAQPALAPAEVLALLLFEINKNKTRIRKILVWK